MAVAQGRREGEDEIVLEIDWLGLVGGDEAKVAIRERIDEATVTVGIRAVREDAGRGVIVGNHGGIRGFVEGRKGECPDPAEGAQLDEELRTCRREHERGQFLRLNEAQGVAVGRQEVHEFSGGLGAVEIIEAWDEGVHEENPISGEPEGDQIIQAVRVKRLEMEGVEGAFHTPDYTPHERRLQAKMPQENVPLFVGYLR